MDEKVDKDKANMDALAVASQLEESYTENFQEIARIKKLIEDAAIASEQPVAKPGLQKQARALEPAHSDDEDLPPPPPDSEDEGEGAEIEIWKTIFSIKHRRWYYANVKTKETRWDMPEESATVRVEKSFRKHSGLRSGRSSDFFDHESHEDPKESEQSMVHMLHKTCNQDWTGGKAFPDSMGIQSQSSAPSSPLDSAPESVRSAAGSTRSASDALPPKPPRMRLVISKSRKSPGAYESLLSSGQRSSRGSRTVSEGEQSTGDGIASPYVPDASNYSAPSSSYSDKPLRVEDWLLMKDEEKKQKLQEKKRLQEEMERRRMRNTPKINKASRRMLKHKDQAPLQNRVSEVLYEQQERRAMAVAQIERQEKKKNQHHGRPKISARGQRQRRDIGVMLEWQADRDKKLLDRMQQQEKEEQATLVFKPKICPKSEQLLRQAQRRTRSLSPTMGRAKRRTVEDRLFAEAGERRKRQQDREKQFDYNVKQRAVPRILSRSNALVIDGDVSERLYKLARERAAPRKKELETEGVSNGHQTQASNYQPYRAHRRSSSECDTKDKPTFTPKINSVSRKLANKTRPANVPVEKTLLEAHKKYEQRRQLRTDRQEQTERAMLDKNKVARKSEEMVSTMEWMQNVSTVDRLYKGLQPHTKPTVEEPKYTFQPQISSKSKKIIAQRGVTDQSIEGRSKQWAEERARKAEKQKKEMDKQEEAECTFQPKLMACESGRAQAFLERYQQQRSTKSIGERSSAWMHKRNEEVEGLRKKQSAADLEGLTFQPEIFSKKKGKSPGSKGKEQRKDGEGTVSPQNSGAKSSDSVPDEIEDQESVKSATLRLEQFLQENQNSPEERMYAYAQQNIAEAVKSYMDTNALLDNNRAKLDDSAYSLQHLEISLEDFHKFDAPSPYMSEQGRATVQSKDSSQVAAEKSPISNEVNNSCHTHVQSEKNKQLEKNNESNGQGIDASVSSLTRNSSSHTIENTKLKPGWLEFFTDDGTPYYYNALEGTSQWERPT